LNAPVRSFAGLLFAYPFAFRCVSKQYQLDEELGQRRISARCKIR